MRKLIGSLFVIGAVLVATPASASPRTEPAPTASTGPYCSTDLGTGQSACFKSEAARKQHLSESALLPLVYLYNWYNFQTGGGSVILAGDHACTATTSDVDYYDGNLGDNVWDNGLPLNDSITSVQTANSCDIKFFEGTNFTGASTPYIDKCSFLGGGGTGDCPPGNWNDRASSYYIS